MKLNDHDYKCVLERLNTKLAYEQAHFLALCQRTTHPAVIDFAKKQVDALATFITNFKEGHE